MKKKLVFIGFILFCSLAVFQYLAMENAFEAKQIEQNKEESISDVVKPAKSEIYSAGDYVVVKKDGKYFVYKKATKST